MPEYEILQDTPAMTLGQIDNTPQAPEASRLSALTQDETEIMATGPSFDPTKRDANAGRLFGKNFLDSTFKFLYDNPATADRALGKQLEESNDPTIQALNKQMGVSDQLKRTQEKYTAKSLALRDHFDMSKDELEPRNFFEQVVAGLGGATPTMLITGAASAGAGAVATAAGAGTKAVKGAQLAGAAYASYSMEKPVLEKELMDAGFEAGFADRMSTYYAIPVAALDAGSFGFLTGVMRPVASQAVSTTIGRMVARGGLNFVASPLGGLVTGALSEGTTEAIQGQIQTEFEVGLGLQSRDFQNDMSSRVVEFVVGALMGGTVGTLHMSGQLQARKAAIAELSETYKLNPSDVAKAYDASTLEATERTLDELGKDRADEIGVTVKERADSVQKAIDKAMGRAADFTGVEPQLDKAKQLTPEEVFKYQEILQKNEAKIIDAKTSEIQKDIRGLQRERLGLSKQVADAQRQLRLIKMDALSAFKEQEGRDPNTGEIGPWAVTKAASLENKIAAMTAKVDSAQGAVSQARGKLISGIKGLANEGDITAIENQIEEANQKLADLQLSEDPKALTTAMALTEQIKALEEELKGLGRPEATVEKAEKAVDEATAKLSAAEDALVTAEARLSALRENALIEFVTEKNRPPKEGELAVWKKEQIAEVTKEIADAQSQISENLRAVQNLQAEAEGLRLGLEQVTGSVSVRASELRQQGIRVIRGLQRGFNKGFKLGIKEANEVARVAQQMISRLSLSDKAKQRLLRRVRPMSVEKFEAKLEAFVQGLMDVKDAETVEGLRNVAADILEKMTTVGKVNPKTILLAEHLRNVFNGKAPAMESPASDSVEDIAKYAIETTLADLAENDTDTAAAEQAVLALKDFYTGELANRLSFTEQIDQTNKRIAGEITKGLTKGGTISPRKSALDAVRQNFQKTGIMKLLFPSPYVESFLTQANSVDAGQGKPNMQGAMVREFDPSGAYRSWMTLLHRTREAIDYKLAEIYGPKFLETLTMNRTANFIDVEFTNEDGTAGESINITKGAAMSLYMMQKNTKIRAQMIKMGYNEAWLDAFSEGNVFSKEDHAWMANVDEILKSYAAQIKPIYEKLTGKPFRTVDNYFMIQRYMFSEDMAGDEVPSMVKAMMDGDFNASDPSNDPRFKRRISSKKEFVLPDIAEAITRYASDMNHFIAYAEYASKLKALLGNGEFKAAVLANKGEGQLTLFNTFLTHIIDGSQSRGSDRAAMKAHFTALGWLARSKIASPRSGFMQFTALAGFTDPTASTPVNSAELAKSVFSLLNALKTGEARNLLDTGYMQERWLGAFDQASKMAEDMARFGVFSQQGKLDPGGMLKKLGTSKTLQEWITLSTRLGDRAPSLLGGWAVYEKVLAKTGDKVAAVTAAVKMIEEVNGSLDPGKSAEVYQKKDAISTLFKLFTRSTSIYLDRYIRMHKAFAAGQLTKAQYAKGLALYHVWIPMFTSMVAMGAGKMFDKDEIKTMMLSGPLAYHLFIGGMFKAAAAGLLALTGINEKFESGYDQTGNLLDGYSQDFSSLSRMIVRDMREFNFEDGWGAVATVGKLGDITPLPVGYISRQPEAVVKILEGYWTEGVMEMMGYSSAATKVE